MAAVLGVLRVAAPVCCLVLATAGEATANPVQTENHRPGRSWRAASPPGRTGYIEGYSSQPSVAPGGVVQFHVDTDPRARYRIEVARLGWYGGLGGRRVACLPGCSSDEVGTSQPPAPAPNPSSGKVDAGWSVTDSLRVPGTWVSGYYIARFVLTSGPYAGRSRAYPFVVLPPARRRSAILVQVPVNTWQAYNAWGGKSLYGFNSTGSVAATKVSFNRPLLDLDLYQWEYPLVRFLEREGYDVAYVTDADVHRDPALLAGHRLVMTAGHDEYWTKQMRDAFEAARDAGVNLAFMGANTAHWQARYEDAQRTLVEYRAASADPEPNPALKTDGFNRLVPPRPECQLEGVQYTSGLSRTGRPHRDYTVTAAAGDPWLAGTGLRPGDVLGDLVGYEWDTVIPGCNVPTPTVLLHYTGSPANADAVRYTAGSGARVFSAGSLQFSWALDDWGGSYNGHPGTRADPRVQRLMRNVLDALAPGQPDPQILRFAAVPARFRAGRGTSFRYTLSRAATVRITVYRLLPRRRRALVRALRHAARGGRNATPFRGRALRAGRYRATIVARLAHSGSASDPVTVAFTVLRR